MKFYRRADGSTRLEEANRVVIVDNGAHTVTVLDQISQDCAGAEPLQWLRRTVRSQSRLNLNFKLPGAAWAGRTFLRRPISELR